VTFRVSICDGSLVYGVKPSGGAGGAAGAAVSAARARFASKPALLVLLRAGEAAAARRRVAIVPTLSISTLFTDC